MEELEYILKSNWNTIGLNTGISAYDYTKLMQWLKPFNDLQKPAKAQEITDNIIEEYFE